MPDSSASSEPISFSLRADKEFLRFLKGIKHKIHTLLKPIPHPYKGSLSFLTGGKFLRSYLMFRVGKLLGTPSSKLTLASSVVEMIHSVSLFHDDVLDVELLRRGQETVSAKYTNKISIMFGDYFLASTLNQLEKEGYPNDVVRDVYRKIEEVCHGEILQDTNAQLTSPIRLATCLKISRLKTGSLFSLSYKIPVALAGEGQACIDFAEECGYTHGLIYQLLDDLNDFQTDVRFADGGRQGQFRHWTLPILFWAEKDAEHFNQFIEGKTTSLKPTLAEHLKLRIRKQVEALLVPLRERSTEGKNFQNLYKNLIESVGPFAPFDLNTN